MRLSNFIREHSEPIIAEWETFAGTLAPASEATSPLSLRNHIKYILQFIADDIDSPRQTLNRSKNPAVRRPSRRQTALPRFTLRYDRPGDLTWIRWFPSIARCGQAS